MDSTNCTLTYLNPLINEERYTGSIDPNLGFKRHGYGTLYFRDGRKYEGQFEEDDMIGKGKLYMDNGDIYIGKFLRG